MALGAFALVMGAFEALMFAAGSLISSTTAGLALASAPVNFVVYDLPPTSVGLYAPPLLIPSSAMWIGSH